MAAFVSLTGGAVYVVGAWFLLPRLGLLGVPVAGILAYLLDTAVSLPYALRRIRASEASVCGLGDTSMPNADVPTRAGASR